MGTQTLSRRTTRHFQAVPEGKPESTQAGRATGAILGVVALALVAFSAYSMLDILHTAWLETGLANPIQLLENALTMSASELTPY